MMQRGFVDDAHENSACICALTPKGTRKSDNFAAICSNFAKSSSVAQKNHHSKRAVARALGLIYLVVTYFHLVCNFHPNGARKLFPTVIFEPTEQTAPTLICPRHNPRLQVSSHKTQVLSTKHLHCGPWQLFVLILASCCNRYHCVKNRRQ